jgi:prolyl-tRNA editing enzyme YbaK/EbsC (Cys-tRNA(Pro) deacylase)
MSVQEPAQGDECLGVFVDDHLACADRGLCGVRGTQIVLAPEDYLRATRGKVGEIARTRSGG